MAENLNSYIYDGRSIVISNNQPPLRLRVIFSIFSLPLLFIGLFSLWRLAISLLSGALSWNAPGDLLVGSLVAVTFTLVPAAILYGVLIVPDKELRLDPVSRTAVLTFRSILGVKRTIFPMHELSSPSVTFYPEGSDRFAQYSIQISVPGYAGSRIEYCPVDVLPSEQKIVCERLAVQIADMMRLPPPNSMS